MHTKLDLRLLLERHWNAQCRLVGKETLERLLVETEKGNTNVDSWAINKAGGTPMDVGIALTALTAGISFLQLALQIYDEYAKQQKPAAVDLKVELSKRILISNSPEGKVLASERGQEIIDELTR